MAYLVAGVWRTRGALPVPAPTGSGADASLPVGDGVPDAVPDLAARVAALGLHDPEDDGEESNVPAGQAGTAQYDWPAYHAVWKETPIDEAITVMFAEFAVLHAEMSGYTCSTAPMPLTLDVGKCIADRAERFVTMYLTPILGAQNSTKVHKLLCHVMEAIRMHGNINNGNAGINERLHKDDKPYYARTNKAIAGFTRQLVVQAQGARIILRRNAEEDECLLAGLEELAGDEDTDSDGAGSFTARTYLMTRSVEVGRMVRPTWLPVINLVREGRLVVVPRTQLCGHLRITCVECVCQPWPSGQGWRVLRQPSSCLWTRGCVSALASSSRLCLSAARRSRSCCTRPLLSEVIHGTTLSCTPRLMTPRHCRWPRFVRSSGSLTVTSQLWQTWRSSQA